jgi:toxin ParE1/3/4
VKLAKVHSAADAGLIEAMDWYDAKRFGPGAQLMEEARDAILGLRKNPNIGARYGNSGRRFYRLKRFPFVIYYRDFPDFVWIAAIAHERRRPGYWKKRKPE